MAEVQRALFTLITGQPLAAPALAPTTAAASLIVGDARASAEQRLHVYAHMYLNRLVETLEAEFPRLARAIGHHAVAKLGAAYAAAHPSRHPSLRFFGQAFPRWLRREGGAVAGLADLVNLDALANLAELEWARTDLFDAADESTLSFDSLRSVPVQAFHALQLRRISASRIIAIGEAASALWDAVGSGTDSAPAQGAPAPEAAAVAGAGTAKMLVWRQGTMVYHRALDENEALLLEQVDAGTTFGALCDSIAALLPSDAATTQAFTWLGTWATDGLLVATS